MNKIVKRYGNTLVISFTKEEAKILKIKVGDILKVSSEKIDRRKKEVKENGI